MRPTGRYPPTIVQPCGVLTTSADQVCPAGSPARFGAPSTMAKSDASAEATHEAAPLERLPAMIHPFAPPTMRDTLTAFGPPYSSNDDASTSIIEPSARCAQVLVRGLPCAPPVCARI